MREKFIEKELSTPFLAKIKSHSANVFQIFTLQESKVSCKKYNCLRLSD